MMTENVVKYRHISPLSMYITMTGAMLQGHEDAHTIMQEMVAGMQRYQSSKFIAQRRRYKTVWQHGATNLRQIQGNNSSGSETIIFIPSLVNKSDIFDLCAERSMAGWLCDQGFDAYILDWGDLFEERSITVSDIIEEKLTGAFAYLKKVTTGQLHCLGYCMGGVLCLGAIALKPNIVDSLALLATPWDFHAGRKALYSRVQYWGPSALMQAEKKQMLSAQSLQMLFASVDPLLAQKKFSRFLSLEEDSEEYNIFVAVEDWLNDGVNIPQSIAQDTIQNWYLNNALVQKKWNINGVAIDIGRINIPLCIVASKKDRLVDFESALAVQKEIPSTHVIEPDCGHIGMIAGAKSIEQVWKPTKNWMCSI